MKGHGAGAHRVAGAGAGHVGAGDDVELGGAVPLAGALTLLALGGVDWGAGLRAQGTISTNPPRCPSPPEVAPTVTRAHVPGTRHFRPHRHPWALGNREWLGSDTAGSPLPGAWSTHHFFPTAYPAHCLPLTRSHAHPQPHQLTVAMLTHASHAPPVAMPVGHSPAHLSFPPHSPIHSPQE